MKTMTSKLHSKVCGGGKDGVPEQLEEDEVDDTEVEDEDNEDVEAA